MWNSPSHQRLPRAHLLCKKWEILLIFFISFQSPIMLFLSCITIHYYSSFYGFSPLQHIVFYSDRLGLFVMLLELFCKKTGTLFLMSFSRKDNFSSLRCTIHNFSFIFYPCWVLICCLNSYCKTKLCSLKRKKSSLHYNQWYPADTVAPLPLALPSSLMKTGQMKRSDHLHSSCRGNLNNPEDGHLHVQPLTFMLQ